MSARCIAGIRNCWFCPITLHCGRYRVNATECADSYTRNGGISLWRLLRRYRLAQRDMEVRHARERAAMTAWVIECQHVIDEAAP